MKRYAHIVNENGNSYMEQRDSGHWCKYEDVAAIIGTAPEGSHPDEQHPRDTTWHRERQNWIKEMGCVRGDNQLLRDQLRALKTTVIATVGGTVEGYPTAEYNYIGRLRELVKIEAEYEQLRKEFNASAELLRSALSIAQRKGNETNWEAFTGRALEQCDKNHSILYPQYHSPKKP